MAARKPASRGSTRSGGNTVATRSPAGNVAALEAMLTPSGSALSTVAGPAQGAALPVAGEPDLGDVLTALMVRQAGTDALARSMPQNALKAEEYGLAAAYSPVAGTPPTDVAVSLGASTRTESNESAKTGSAAPPGADPSAEALIHARADGSGQMLTTNQGVRIADNQSSLKIGLRGPTALEDFILREKITHFDHERIPERVVHARGSGAHGYFECTAPIIELTAAVPFSKSGKRTPVFVRFSTVAGERGSADTVRDVRGFAIKFYTEDGNWDLVGNNMPVFFIQDAMKFPDLVHAVKPEPNNGIPQASSAHDTFWDFVSLMPESTHMLLWQMSDRAIPRSYRMMQGFGVHTFRLVNAEGQSVFCKFHFNPVAGTHSLAWDEAVKISGADADFHRRDLWEAIEGGAYPEWELALQVFTEEQAEDFAFDVLDSTKLIPEELVPLQVVGRLVLNRNPDNFFAETEQVAFCTAHLIPGIDFSNDPLLQGRIHSYLDTQISRLGGANFHQLPINAPLAPVHNNQRDGQRQQAVHRGRVAYEPNSLAGGCPFQAGMNGFVSFPETVAGDKVRGKPERFADHYSQARLFWRSQSAAEQRHIINAFSFELTRVQTPAVRERVLSLLANVDTRLVAAVATNLGVGVPGAAPMLVEVDDARLPEHSTGLSLTSRPGNGEPNARRVAIIADAGAQGASVLQAYARLLARGAVARMVGANLQPVVTEDGHTLPIEATCETLPSVLWDGVVIAGSETLVEEIGRNAVLRTFLAEQYRHGKPMLVLNEDTGVLQAAGIPADKPVAPAVDLLASIDRFCAALGSARDWSRETDPPRV